MTLVQVFLSVVHSILFNVLAAGFIGAVFGYFTARGLTCRLIGNSIAGNARSQGDFSAFIQDRSSDQLIQLAQQLNRMAEQLQNVLKTKQDLATLEERNRLGRDLHDRVEQLVFATMM
jgi:signal transduction histidine kinase